MSSLTLAGALALTLLATVPAQAADGAAVYNATCVTCHATGVANAPKLGDKAAWAPRTVAGKDGLLKSVLAGKGAMPPKAGNAKLSDGEIAAAIDYMLTSVK